MSVTLPLHTERVPEQLSFDSPPSGPSKRCARCGDVQSLDDFPLDASRRDGRFPTACCATASTRLGGSKRTLSDTLRASTGSSSGRSAGKRTIRRNIARSSADAASCGGPKKACRACVRALLCFRHNLLLGAAGDDPMVLARAIAYLDAHDPEVREQTQRTKERLAALRD